MYSFKYSFLMLLSLNVECIKRTKISDNMDNEEKVYRSAYLAAEKFRYNLQSAIFY